MTDLVATPVRKPMIPAYDEVEKICFEHGCVGFNISGSGPSMFAFFKDQDELEAVKEPIREVYQNMNLPRNHSRVED